VIQSHRRVLVSAVVSFFLLASLAKAGDAQTRAPRGGGKEVYIVELSAPPLALSQPRSGGGRKLDTGSEGSLRYVENLRQGQRETLAAVRAKVGREVAALHQYTRVFNGLALELSKEEAGLISRLPGVRRVEPEVKLRLQSDSGPAWMGAPGIWDGTQTGGLPGTKGEGVVIGIVDTGINMDHPSFADIGGDGYNHSNPRGAGNYAGWCSPSNPDYDPALICNDKLIGVWSYVWSGTPEDEQGHGTQLASVAAGNFVNVPVTAGLVRTISGAAPHANLIAYNACDDYGYCYSSEVIAAIDQAVDDGVDVLNVSFAGSYYSSPWADSVAQALLGAREAGVFVASAAGNSGSYSGSISSPATAPWVLAVGASTHNRRFSSSFTGLSGGGTPPPIASGLAWTNAAAAAPVVKAGGTGDCYASYPAGTFTGKIVACWIDPHDIGQSTVSAIKAAGALGVVLVDSHTHPEDTKYPVAYNHPAVRLVDDANIAAFWNWMGSGAGHNGRIDATTAAVSASYADVVPAFSSRGPGSVGDVLRPDLVAPGVQILAASSDGFGDYEISDGTSLSSALAAGAAALLIDLHPAWTPAEVQSAMMTTAKATGLRDYNASPLTNPLAIGSGRLNLGAAAKAGLVFDETAADFVAANPALNGVPQSLNLASLADDSCVLGCGWTRTVRNTLAVTTNWMVSSLATPAGTNATITPFSFTLPPGGTQTIQVQLDGPPSQYGWATGSLTLTETGSLAPPVRLPIATRWLPQYGLTVSKAGTGSGRVTSSPAGIDCGPNCSALFPDESTILLTPTADPGSTFVGWNGWECYGTENPCYVNIWGYSEQVTAYFDLQPADKALANRVGFKDGMNPPVDRGTWRYYYADLPAGTGELVVDLLDVTGDVVLYVRHGSKPTWNAADCSDYDYYGLPNRRCAITAPAGGRWWIGVNNDQTGPIQYSVRASWGSITDQALSNAVPLGDFVSSAAAGEAWKYYYVDLAGGDSELVVDLKRLSADADLFVRHGAKPDRSNYGCTSAAVGTGDERCTVPSPAAGRWWIGVNNFSSGTVTYDVQASWVSTSASDFYTVIPCRLVDTRQSYPMQSRQPRSFLAAGHCGIPVTAKAVALNVTVVNATGGGNVTVYPANLSVPLASAISFAPGGSRASNALVRLSTDGEGRIGVTATLGLTGQVDVLLDVAGYFE
jgi:hypothetical protein